MLTDGDGVDADVVGQHRLVDDGPYRPCLRHDLAPIVARQIAEAVDAECDL
jgi:hypothetical protein